MLAKNFKKSFLDEDSLVASYEWIRDLFQDTPEGLSTSEEEIFIDFTSRTELEFAKEVVTTKVSISVSFPINTRNGIDDLQLVDIKCGHTSIKAVFDTGAQIAVLREDLIGKGCGEGEGTIQIISAFGEKEIAALKLFNLFDLGNQRDFESTRDKAIEIRKEMEELRKETENETRTREAGYKEEHASFKAEVEA
ncbi:hypothetical protein TNCV_2673991 [Trichonephila clavipes]|nr:hypothetical protein TNCV_2673991 [Trichonephila clavipes]